MKRVWMLEQTENDIKSYKNVHKYVSVMLFTSRKKAIDHLKFRLERLLRKEYTLIIDQQEAINESGIGYVYLSKTNEGVGSTVDLTVSSKNIH